MSINPEMQNKTKRGRKSNMQMPDPNKKVTLKIHHFNYSDDFANQLATFATAHLEDNSKLFKKEWQTWKDANSALIQQEITKMQSDGFQGSVEDKMYFSARYYYRKKAIRDNEYADSQKQEPESNHPRKKYEMFDKTELGRMNTHILSQIYNAMNEGVIDQLSPSKSFAHYLEQYAISNECERTKKTYKNLYWRISKKCRENNNLVV
jgi:hypothetical protein